MNKRVKELRKKLKLTQQEFANSINLSKSSIGNIENGIVNLTDRNIKEICSKHKVNEEWLRYGTGEIFVELTKDEEFAYLVGALMADDDPYKKDFIRAMLDLEDKADWDLVMKLVEGLKEKNKKSGN